MNKLFYFLVLLLGIVTGIYFGQTDTWTTIWNGYFYDDDTYGNGEPYGGYLWKDRIELTQKEYLSLCGCKVEAKHHKKGKLAMKFYWIDTRNNEMCVEIGKKLYDKIKVGDVIYCNRFDD
jgi:hypothetical protein